MAMALVLNQRFWGRGILRSFVLIPWAMSPVAVGILWGWMLNGNYGTFNGILTDLGLIDKPIAWLADGWAALNLVALVHIWNQAPLASLLILAGLQSMPENLHRAARIDGAGPGRASSSITLPWLRPMLLLVLILTSINSIMAFDLFWTITKGGPGSATTVFSWMGYAYAFQFFRFGEGAAILYVLTILCLSCLRLPQAVLPDRGRGRPAARGGRRRRAREPRPAAGHAGRGHGACPAPARARCRRVRRRRLAAGPAAPAARPARARARGVLIFVWSAGPFLWLVIMSLSPSVDLVRTPPTVVPQALTLENYPLRALSRRGRRRPVERAGDPRALLDLEQLRRRALRDRHQRRDRLARRLRLCPARPRQAHDRLALGADDDPDDAEPGADPAVLHHLPHGSI